MTFVIAMPCVDVKDKACIDDCPVDCIYEGERTLYIHPDECIDCGACEPVCPVEAIFFEDDTPPEWQHFNAVNAEFFYEIGSPGGSSKVGPIGRDHPIVAALPPQGAGGIAQDHVPVGVLANFGRTELSGLLGVGIGSVAGETDRPE